MENWYIRILKKYNNHCTIEYFYKNSSCLWVHDLKDATLLSFFEASAVKEKFIKENKDCNTEFFVEQKQEKMNNIIPSVLKTTIHNIEPTIELNDLPVGGCFMDQYGQVFMKINNTFQSPECYECVVLSKADNRISGLDIGNIVKRNVNSKVRFVSARLEIYK